MPGDAAYCSACGKKQAPEPRRILKRPNGTGSVYKLSGRRVRPWVASRNKVIIGYYEKKTDALDALSKTTGKRINERYNLTVSEVYELWKLEHFRKLTPKGVSMYENAYKDFTALKERRMRSIRAEDYQKIIDAMAERGLSRSVMEKIKQLAGQLSKWAMREEIIEVNYAQFIILPKAQKREKEIFTDAEIKKLKANSDDDTVKLILILIYTGMRIGELMSVKKEDVHLNEGYLVAGSKTEAGRDRTIPISNKLRVFVRRFYDKAPAGGLLIDGYDGNRTVANFRKREYYETLERLGIERKTPHSTRHTFASLASKAGVKPDLLQKVIGHADYATTAGIYIHKDVDELRTAIDQL